MSVRLLRTHENISSESGSYINRMLCVQVVQGILNQVADQFEWGSGHNLCFHDLLASF